jgi:hypothetical protein
MSAKVIHGQSRSKLYRIWIGMKVRCYDSNHQQYHNYGGRGIKVCDRWLNSFCNFLSDMGNPPVDKKSLDRIDVNGNYEPINCRWSDRFQQQNNKRNNRIVEHEGKRLTISQWSILTGLHKHTIRVRLNSGWSSIDALTYPLRKMKNNYVAP